MFPRLTEHPKIEEIAASIGSVGDALDNAMFESGNGLYKTECIRTDLFHVGPYKSLAGVEFATAGWVDWVQPLPAPRRPRTGPTH